MVEFRYHGEWYTLLIIDIIDWNDLEKLVNNSYILFIQTKILILPLENHYINFLYVIPVCLILKWYYTKM